MSYENDEVTDFELGVFVLATAGAILLFVGMFAYAIWKAL